MTDPYRPRRHNRPTTVRVRPTQGEDARPALGDAASAAGNDATESDRRANRQRADRAREIDCAGKRQRPGLHRISQRRAGGEREIIRQGVSQRRSRRKRARARDG